MSEFKMSFIKFIDVGILMNLNHILKYGEVPLVDCFDETKILLVSHRWETIEQPDPYNLQFSEVLNFLNNSNQYKFLFYDYSCLPQKPRSLNEQALFKSMLKEMDVLYLSCKVLVLNRASSDYHTRGWCFFEWSLSVGNQVGNYNLFPEFNKPMRILRSIKTSNFASLIEVLNESNFKFEDLFTYKYQGESVDKWFLLLVKVMEHEDLINMTIGMIILSLNIITPVMLIEFKSSYTKFLASLGLFLWGAVIVSPITEFKRLSCCNRDVLDKLLIVALFGTYFVLSIFQDWKALSIWEIIYSLLGLAGSSGLEWVLLKLLVEKLSSNTKTLRSINRAIYFNKIFESECFKIPSCESEVDMLKCEEQLLKKHGRISFSKHLLRLVGEEETIERLMKFFSCLRVTNGDDLMMLMNKFKQTLEI